MVGKLLCTFTILTNDRPSQDAEQALEMLRTAAHPKGPWSAPTELITVEAPENVYGWVYDFLAHPELSQDDGRTIYITYSQSIDEKHTQLKLVAVEVEPTW